MVTVEQQESGPKWRAQEVGARVPQFWRRNHAGRQSVEGSGDQDPAVLVS